MNRCHFSIQGKISRMETEKTSGDRNVPIFFWYRFTKKNLFPEVYAVCTRTTVLSIQRIGVIEIDSSFFFYIAHGKKEKKKKRKVSSETETFHSRFRGFGWVVDKFVYLQHFSPRLADDVATSSLSLMGKPFGQRIDLIIAISAAARSSSRRREIST